MSASPAIRHARRVYELLLPRCTQLQVRAWLCDASGKVIARPVALSDEKAHSAAALEHDLATAALAIPAEGNLIHLSGGGWAVRLRLTSPGHRGPLIIVIIPQDRTKESAIELATVLQWSFADLGKSLKDDETLAQLGGKLTHAYEQMNLLFRLSRLFNHVQSPHELLQRICHELCDLLPLSWLGLKFCQENRDIPDLQGRLFLAGEPPLDEQTLKDHAEGLVARCGSDGWTRLLKPPASEFAAAAGSDVLAEMISHNGHMIGVLMAGTESSQIGGFCSDEMQFLHSVAEFLGIFHGSMARLIEQRSMFMGTLKALTASIDAKDPYTRGHSERVAVLTRKFAAALSMSEADIETYYVSALVHDIGKIGVPEAVLSKVGKLDDSEFAWIRRHPEIGHRILKDIPSMGAMLSGVLHHHERWDGRGYPHRLAGEQIPLLARVIAFADTFDAMSSDRSYRPALPREQIIAEIRQCAGSQFDPKLVDTFLRLDFSEFDAMLGATAVKAAA